MFFCYKRPRASDQVSETATPIPWTAEIRKAYRDAPIEIADEFESCVALFTAIRKHVKLVGNTKDDPSKIFFKLCVMLTDQGYLAAQTLDVLSHAKNVDFLTTRIGYLKLPTKGEIHKACSRKALSAVLGLCKCYFSDSTDLKTRAEKLLDRFYQRCSKASSVSESVSYPDENEIPELASLIQDDNVYPDEHELAIAEHTKVHTSGQGAMPAIEYFKQLCEGRNGEDTIAFSDFELAFFINLILRAYWNADRGYRTADFNKKYCKLIGEEDLDILKQQAQDSFKLYALGNTILIISQIKRAKRGTAKRSPERTNGMYALCEEQIETFIHALTQHHNEVHSARTRARDDKELEQYFYDFVTRIDENWHLLCEAPYLIYLLWVSKYQNAFAARKSIQLSKLIDGACKPRVINPNDIQVNRSLFHAIVALCQAKRGSAPESWEKSQLHLFELAEAPDCEGKTTGIFEAYWREVEKYRTSCLNIPFACVPTYPSRIPKTVLEVLLQEHESELSGIRSSLRTLAEQCKSARKNRRQNEDEQPLDITACVYEFFVRPSESGYMEIGEAENTHMSAFSWDILQYIDWSAFPSVSESSFRGYKNAYEQCVKTALLEWCALQNIREDHQRDLLSAFQQLYDERLL